MGNLEIAERLLNKLPVSSRLERAASGYIVRVKLPGSYAGWKAFKGETLRKAYEGYAAWLEETGICAFCNNEATGLNGLCDECNWEQHFGEIPKLPATYA